MSSSARMDCIITFKILFKILGTLTLQAFLNEFKNRLTSALLQGIMFFFSLKLFSFFHVPECSMFRVCLQVLQALFFFGGIHFQNPGKNSEHYTCRPRFLSICVISLAQQRSTYHTTSIVKYDRTC